MKSKWFMFLVLFLSGVTVALSQLKVPPIMGILSEQMNISLSEASWLMSIFTVGGIVFAIPGASIMNKLGPKKLLLCLMASLCVGNMLGGMTRVYPVLLLSRMIEGIAFAMIILVALVMINTWFGEKAGSAIGIFNTFAAVGSFITMNACLPITNAFGLKSLWFIVGGLAALCFALVLFFIKMPEDMQRERQEKGLLKEASQNKHTWIVAGAMGCIAFVLFTFVTSYPQLFTGLYGIAPNEANFYASLNGLFGIPFCILCGFIVDKTGKPMLVALLGFIALALTCMMTTLLGPTTFVLHTILTALFGGVTLTAMFCIAPAVAKRPACIGYTLALVNLVYYIGVFACSPVILGTAESMGWQMSATILVGVSVVGACLVAYLIFKTTKENN